MPIKKIAKPQIQNIALFGSTGSIGTQTLEVIRANADRFKVIALAAGRNQALLRQQIEEFRPQVVALPDSEHNSPVISTFPDIKFIFGPAGLDQLAQIPDVAMVIMALNSDLALYPTLTALKNRKELALATKEVMVTAGEEVMRTAKTAGITIRPIDSEHSAIAQCLQGEEPANIKRIIITASGGPFLYSSPNDLINVTPEQALRHPNWSMGPKISVDSATMMNKGLEVIEAAYLFDLSVDKIEVVIHPQSIIHSLVEFIDGSIVAQLGAPDMRLPIQYALSMPARWPVAYERLDFSQKQVLEFFPVPEDKFPCVKLAYQALRAGGDQPARLNVANTEAVELFLAGKIRFTEIAERIKKTIDDPSLKPDPQLT